MKDGSQSLIQISSCLPEIPQEENAAESWETLEEVCWTPLLPHRYASFHQLLQSNIWFLFAGLDSAEPVGDWFFTLSQRKYEFRILTQMESC